MANVSPLMRIVDAHLPSTGSELNNLRGTALDKYVGLEGMFLAIFQFAVGTRTAGTFDAKKGEISRLAFSKLISARARNDVVFTSLHDLLGRKHEKLIKSLKSEVDKLDRTRNALAHWATSADIGSDGRARSYLHNYSRFSVGDIVFVEEIRFFVSRVLFLHLIFTCIIHHLNGATSVGFMSSSIQEVLDAPFTYPPAETHPLHDLWASMP